jgi:branched-chain amino acid transport system permease protein
MSEQVPTDRRDGMSLMTLLPWRATAGIGRSTSGWQVMWWLLILVATIAFGMFSNNERFLTLAIQTYVLAALASSWNILGGFAGQVSLGHAAFFGLGALITRELWLGGRSLPIAVVVALIVTAVAAAVIGVPMLRFRGIYFSVGTLALAVGVFLTAGNLWPGISSLPAEALRAYEFHGRYFSALGVVVVTVLFAAWLKRSKIGLGMMTVREDEEAASATGVNAFIYKMAAFVISAVLAALAGSVFGFFSASYYPQFPFSAVWTFDAITVVFVGGVGTIVGPLIGAVFFVTGRDLLRSTFPELQVIVFGVLFILVVLLLPGGFVEGGQRIYEAVSRQRRDSAAPTEAESEGEKQEEKERMDEGHE